MRAWALLLLAIALPAFLHSLLASPAFAGHETRFKGQGLALNLELLLLALTAAVAILCFVALIAIVRFWERREEEAASQTEGQTDRQGEGEIYKEAL